MLSKHLSIHGTRIHLLQRLERQEKFAFAPQQLIRLGINPMTFSDQEVKIEILLNARSFKSSIAYQLLGLESEKDGLEFQRATSQGQKRF